MTLDLFAIGLVGIFALLGAFTGAWGQAIHLAGMAGGFAAARLLSVRFGPALAEKTGLPSVFGVVLLALLAGFGVFLLVHFAGRWLLRRARGEAGPGGLDRSVGVLLGAAKSALAVWFLVSLIVLLERPVQGLGWHLDTRGSEVAGVARRWNLLAHTGLPMKDLERALAKKDLVGGDPRLQRAAGDKGLRKALAEGDYVTALRSADVLAILSDPALTARLYEAKALMPKPEADGAAKAP